MEDKDSREETLKAGPEGAEPEEGSIREIPREQVRRLEEELEAKRKEADFNHDRFLRAVADLENYKKRAEREKGEVISYAAENIVAEVLPVMDNLLRALEHTEKEGNLKSLVEGVRLTLGQLGTALRKFGLEEIRAVGEKFDPLLHHAISTEEASAPPGTVVKEFQKGYMLKGRVLRASMVAVSKGPEEKE